MDNFGEVVGNVIFFVVVVGVEMVYSVRYEAGISRNGVECGFKKHFEVDDDFYNYQDKGDVFFGSEFSEGFSEDFVGDNDHFFASDGGRSSRKVVWMLILLILWLL